MLNRSRSFILLLLILGLCVSSHISGCRGRSSQSTAGYSDSLLVYPGAKSVNFSKYKGTGQVTYRVREEFPASNVLTFISHQLEEKGWEPLQYSYLNSDIPSSRIRGWTEFVDSRKPTEQIVHQWSADWKDPSANIVTYVLRYNYPKGQRANLTDLEVVGIYMPAPLAKQGREAARKLQEEYYKNSPSTERKK